MRIQPVTFTWQEVEVIDGDGVAARRMAMVPHRRYDNVSKRQYSDGDDYTLAPIEERSMASHNQYFAALHEYWLNLPEDVSVDFPSEEHFRAWLLIESNWFDQLVYHFATNKDARAFCIHHRSDKPFSRISPNGTVVVIRTAKSQSRAAMGKAGFEASKKAVLDLAAGMVGVKPSEMMKHAGRHA